MEKIRYLLAGSWNALFGWGTFSLLWLTLGSALSLWLICVIAHLVATSQAFYTQRTFVFRAHDGKLTSQFLRFQLTYLFLLALGVLVVYGFSAQGISPIIAQFFAMALSAACGFILGKSFTFSPAELRLSAMRDRMIDGIRSHAVAIGCFLVSLVLFEWVWGRSFYASDDTVGHDFALAATSLLEGKYWVDSNGLISALFNPPWFTPAWCAGTAFYADPQAAYFSPVQWLAFLFDPFTATHLNTLLFAAVAYWGSYCIGLKLLKWSRAGALIFAVLGMVNTFLPLRAAVGEVGYQHFYIWTFLVLALCWPLSTSRRWFLEGPVLIVALGLTAWLQFGFGGMMVPAYLGVLLFSLVLAVQGRADFWRIVSRSAFGAALAFLINGVKIMTGASLMQNFPRNFYELPGFPELGEALTSILMGLMQPSEISAHYAMKRMEGIRWTIFPHEWALNFGWGALMAALLSAFLLLRRSPAQRIKRTPYVPIGSSARITQFLAWTSILVISVIPVLLLWSGGPARELLKQIPILNSATWPMRWIAIYVPVLQLLLAWPLIVWLSGLSSRATAWWGGLLLALIWMGPLIEPIDYYLDPDFQAYNPIPVMQAFEKSRHSPPPRIERLTKVVPESYGSRNDVMVDGHTQIRCYNPIYGYRLEAFPQFERLREAASLDLDLRGQSLIMNPACLVHPQENGCVPGDGFRIENPSERGNAEKFLARKPMDWQRPLTVEILSVISQLCFWVILALLLSQLWSWMLSACMPTSSELKKY